MNTVKFEPWVGSRYGKRSKFGFGILVLGESHWGDDPNVGPEFTAEIVRWLAQSEPNAFFTKISKLLLGLDESTWLPPEKRAEVWEEVAFYNFIQGFVGNGPRISPTKEMIERSRKPYLGVLEKLKPSLVLVLGKGLSKIIPVVSSSSEFCIVQHPSTGFSYKLWGPVFQEALQRAASRSKA